MLFYKATIQFHKSLKALHPKILTYQKAMIYASPMTKQIPHLYQSASHGKYFPSTLRSGSHPNLLYHQFSLTYGLVAVP